jgi:hypothetical protein
MEVLGVTSDVLYAAIGEHNAAKEVLFAVKKGVITSKNGVIVRVVDLFAVMRGVTEAQRVSFAVMRGDHSAI